jgi:hypothetical protein
MVGRRRRSTFASCGREEEEEEGEEGAASEATGAAMLPRAEARAAGAPARRQGRACTPAGPAMARIC